MVSLLPNHLYTMRQTQPYPLSNLSLAERALMKESQAEEGQVACRRIRGLVLGTSSIACDVLAILIILIYVVPGTAFLAITLCVGLGLMFGFIPALGTISMLTGNSILRACHLAHYTDNAMAGAIGATGSTTLIPPLLYIFLRLPKDEDGITKMPPWYIRIVFHISVTSLSGPLGAAVLRNNGTDALHAARAGVLGGVILCPGSIALAPYIIEALREILPYFGDAMKFGYHWISKHSGKVWDVRRRYKTTYCSMPEAEDD